VTWRKSSNGIRDMWEFYSVGDAFENGASFMETVKLAKSVTIYPIAFFRGKSNISKKCFRGGSNISHDDK
jgi:hypothetical protein